LRYAGLITGAIIEEGEARSPDISGGLTPPRSPGPKPKVGDFVQCMMGGMDQFPEPCPIVAISEDGMWAFFDPAITKSGAPIDTLTIVRPSMEDTKSPPVSPPKPASPPHPFAGGVSTMAPVTPAIPTPPGLRKPEGETISVGPRISIDLAHGNSIEIRMKAKVTRKELEKIKKMVFALAELSFIKDEEVDVDEDEK